MANFQLIPNDSLAPLNAKWARARQELTNAQRNLRDRKQELSRLPVTAGHGAKANFRNAIKMAQGRAARALEMVGAAERAVLNARMAHMHEVEIRAAMAQDARNRKRAGKKAHKAYLAAAE